jgi:acyl carrier protein
MYSTFDKIRKILYEKFSFHYDQIELQTELELQLGMDSREMLEFLAELEKNFNINISFDEVDNLIEENGILTIRDIVEYIEKRQQKREF